MIAVQVLLDGVCKQKSLARSVDSSPGEHQCRHDVGL